MVLEKVEQSLVDVSVETQKTQLSVKNNFNGRKILIGLGAGLAATIAVIGAVVMGVIFGQKHKEETMIHQEQEPMQQNVAKEIAEAEVEAETEAPAPMLTEQTSVPVNVASEKKPQSSKKSTTPVARSFADVYPCLAKHLYGRRV